MNSLMTRLTAVLLCGVEALDAQRAGAIDQVLVDQAHTVRRTRALLSERGNAASAGLEQHAQELLGKLRHSPLPRSLRVASAIDHAFSSSAPELLDRACVPKRFKSLEIANLDGLNRTYGNYEHWARMVARLVPRDARLHDLAAGNGGFYRHLATCPEAASWQLSSSDLDPDYVRAGKALAARAGVRVRFEQRDATALSPLAGQTELFTLTSAAHHLSPGVLMRLLRSAAESASCGVLLIDPLRSARVALIVALATTIHPLAWVNLPDAVQSVRRAYLPSELKLLARAAGLQVEAWFEPPLFVACRATLGVA